MCDSVCWSQSPSPIAIAIAIAMLRASSSHLPPLSALGRSLSLLPSPSSLRPSTFLHSLSSLRLSSFKPSLSRTSPLGFQLSPPMPDRPCLRPAASFSSESGSDVAREILVQHLLVKESDQKLLVDIQQRIARGEDLSDLAVEYSICPSKDEGGMLGWVRKGQMVPEFEEAAFGASLNKVVRCKTQFGWHLLQVLSEREESLLQDIQPEDFHAKMQDPSFTDEAQLIDVREPDEVAQASLPGFEALPLRQFGTWGPEINSKFDPQKDTYVMCHHGVRSLQVAKWLQTQGFRKIYNIAGGIHAYAVKADQTIPTY